MTYPAEELAGTAEGERTVERAARRWMAVELDGVQGFEM